MRQSYGRFVGPLVAVVLVAIAIFLTVQHYGGSGEQATSRATPKASEAPTSGKPSVVSKDTVQLNQRVRAFSKLYFSLSPAKSPEQIRSEVASYATEHFLQTATFGFGTSKADKAMLAKGGSIVAKAVSGLNGMFLSERTVTGSVTILKTELDRDGNVVRTIEVQQEMTWEKSNGVWLVYEAPRT